jgi:hypothetical protein
MLVGCSEASGDTTTGAPHWRQKFMPATASAPHPGQKEVVMTETKYADHLS